MDNWFEILIYLFIIFSIFSPLFKKKKELPPPPPRQRVPEEEEDHIPVTRTTMEKSQEEYDILKEIEALFKTDTSVPEEVKPKYSTIEKAEGAQSSIERAESVKRQTNIERLKSEASRSAGEIQPVSSEHKYSDWSRKISVDDSIARKAAIFEERLNKKKNAAYSESIGRITEKIKNPQSLRDYIIFAEILGKPKALRR